MSQLIEKLNTLGNGIIQIITGPQSLYAIYCIVFLFGTYALFNNLFQKKISLFAGKPGKVLAFMISVITTGAVFYGSTKGKVRTMEELLYLFNGFGGFIILLAFSAGIFFIGYSSFKKYHSSNQNVSFLFLFSGIYLGSSMLKMAFITQKIVTDLIIVPSTVGYMGYFQPAISEPIFYILNYSALFSGILVLIYLFLVITGLFSSNDSTNSFTNTNSKKDDAHAKRITDFKSLLSALLSELKDVNNHFNNKINLLNNLRVEIGKLREYDKGGKK